MRTTIHPQLLLTLPLLLALACKNGAEDESGNDGGGDCPSDAEFFEASVWKPVLSQTCITCHNATGLAKDTRMVLVPDSEDGYLDKNLATVREVARVDVGGTSLLLLKPSNKHPDGHEGGMVVTEGTENYEALAEFVERSLGTFTCSGSDDEAAAACDMGGAGVRRVRRLSHVEYNRTVAALLGAPTDLGLGFATDGVIQGYSNNADALLVTGLLADQYREAAEQVADEISADLPARLPCAAEADAACAATFIADFGKQAYRRPLTATEKKRYQTLFDEAAKAEDFAGGLRWVVAAMLQAPGFLYRTELGDHVGDGVYALTPHELASELSYLIVGGPPDAALTAAADDGTLTDPEVLKKHAERLLADPDSDATLHRFVDEWLHIDRLPSVPRDATLFPELTAAVRSDMRGETHRLIAGVFRDGGKLGDLLTASHSYMTDALVDYYGVTAGSGEADAAGFKRVDTGAAAGLLGLGAVMTTHALPTSSSPIHRGKLVRERLLCQDMPPPPPALDTSPPPVDPTLSTRERYTQHSADPTCAGCHARIDPIGFGFEYYDPVGRLRSTDGSHAIDASGEILLTDNSNGPFDGAEELAALLAGSPDVEACYALQWARFAVGSADGSELQCVQSELTTAFAEAEGRLDTLVLALVGTRFFRERGGAPSGEPDPGADTGAMTSAPDTGGDTSDPDTGAMTSDPDTGGDPNGPMTSPGVDVNVVQDSKWEAGECNSVTVTNTTDAQIDWQVVLELPGTIQNAWNAKYTQMDTTFVWVGEAYNAQLAGKASTTFGFCLNY
ncbi:MAG: DUF1592 domain-containing protein [Myxococcales bacterium]|nr:DUF1592 domain-containing protein [Myxococcales bacterium]